MLRLRDIMTTQLKTIAPELTIRAAMEMLVAEHLGGAPVVAGTKVVGVISMTDLIGFAASLSGVPTERPELAERDDSQEFAEPVEGEEPSGLFFSELWADAGADVSERFAESRGPEWNMLDEHTVDEAMTSDIKALAPDTPVDRAADVMRTAGVHRILVMEGESLVGLVSASDIADAVADHRLNTRTYVFGKKATLDERGWQ